MFQFLNNQWHKILKNELCKDYFVELMLFVQQEYEQYIVFPPKEKVLAAFSYTDYEQVRVVILGQDPYHAAGQANGLSFAVENGIAKPPSLKNIYKELENDVGQKNEQNLQSWANQGVLLLNTILTVREGEPNSHKGKGWEIFTDAVLSCLSKRKSPIIFLLWGKDAQKKETLIASPFHTILKAPHPSPLSAYRGFFGCKHFSKVNEILRNNGSNEIEW